MKFFRRNSKIHWERVYKKHSSTELGWYQGYPEISLKLIKDTGLETEGSIIDIGGGTSTLAKNLLDQGYIKVTVLDISGNAIENAKSQLGNKSDRINWIEADVTKFSFMEQYDIWHDRAVFHFLTEPGERKGYKDVLNQALRPNGHLVISTFSPKAPPRCSGLPVFRCSSEALQNEFENFTMVDAIAEDHVTPSGVIQNFTFCRFVKRQ